MRNNFQPLSGIMATAICIFAYLIFSSINADYSHLTKAFSELASIGQPNYLWFAVFGFLIPGLLVTLFSLKLCKWVNNGNVRKYPFILIALSGLLIALGASPMNYENYSSLSSTLHIIGVMGSGLFFIIGAFTISKQLRKDKQWQALVKPLLICAWLLIITGFFRQSAFPGLAQKLGILAYYIYIALLSWNAYRIIQLRRTAI
ncbi:DUF998 domain-containing protein [Marivirga sp. S37H4]|uniref:DUF998 domain-containing protein n=1 Tax=Marivirga aurantiaca TaxID=2802615 RepID=A0A934X0K9_9BACT|nr:DUF998 domain-containing protein [Marivirga aurantiaca]MBK6266165.1 DUF998 domain-containing protein [Marivirga aurantiaca]